MPRAFSTLLDNIPGMAYRCQNDRDWTMEFVSPKAEELTGYSAETLLDENSPTFGDLVHPGDREFVWERVQAALDAREPFQFTYRIVRADGETRWVDERGCGVWEDDELVALEGFISDVTEHREVRERFLQAHKMRTLNRMATEMANKFRDLLSLVLTYADFVGEHIEETSEVREDVDRIIEAAERAVEMTRQLLSFSSRSAGRPKPNNMNVLLEDLVSLIEEMVSGRIDVEFDLEDGLWLTDIDVSEFEQIVMNLVTNACDAMGDAGTLVIRTANHEVSGRHVEGEPGLDAPEGFVRLSVIDDGAGMSEEVRRKAVEPYFTTKEGDLSDPRFQGSGLGLTTCYNIVDNLGGALEIESTEGKGTRVDVFLPRSDA
jgi:PAS domain S-box-containing protein